MKQALVYTRFEFSAPLLGSTPQSFFDLMAEIDLRQKSEEFGLPPNLPEHFFFATPGCERFLYGLKLKADFRDEEATDLRAMYLNADVVVDNNANEIDEFLDWVAPFLDCPEPAFVGYHRYEAMQIPVLIFACGGQFAMHFPKDEIKAAGLRDPAEEYGGGVLLVDHSTKECMFRRIEKLPNGMPRTIFGVSKGFSIKGLDGKETDDQEEVAIDYGGME